MKTAILQHNYILGKKKITPRGFSSPLFCWSQEESQSDFSVIRGEIKYISINYSIVPKYE